MVQFALKSGPAELELFEAGGGMAAMALGLSPEKAESLANELSEYSKSLNDNPVFEKAPSVLSYCYSVAKPDHGLATVYLPENIEPETRRIVFIHGYGGGIFPLLSPIIQTYPESVVIAPAFGISGGGISSEYVDESIQSAAEITELASVKFKKLPMLIGLSAGGFSGFQIYSETESNYSGFICLASYPQSKTLKSNGPIRILCGLAEPFVKNGTLHRTTNHLRGSDFEVETISGADHFFLLTHRKQTSETLRNSANDIFETKNL